MHRRHVAVSSLALAWALLVATPATALSPVPPLDSNAPQPSEASTVEETPQEAEVTPGRGVPVLQAGDRGRKVKVLQVRLQRVGVRDMPVSGLYGE
ncbi:MAG TPA: hypothetical protein VM638_01435, partial [Actinomycetota bacterium]|nr:hypothetical protein [Actinomycetota bacterium]